MTFHTPLEGVAKDRGAGWSEGKAFPSFILCYNIPMSYRIINPVLSGFYPSPSLCVANGMLYMVAASFTYFPAFPVFISKNGVAWTQIGNVISSAEQIDMRGHGASKRLLSPTIRYDASRGEKGRFWCTGFQYDGLGCFLTYSDNIALGWQKPVHIEGSVGFDPSLFFDDDGTAWYCGVREATVNKFYDNQSEIFIQKIDLDKAKVEGQPKVILSSQSKFTGWMDSARIFKFEDYYYLIYSEGGFTLNYGVCVARSKSLDGEWEVRPSNPLLSHRSMGPFAKIQNVGHADMYCDKDGRWWLCVSACRPYGEKSKRSINMDRESFIVPVKWEGGWPYAAYESGHIDNAYSLSGLVVKRADDDADAVIFPVIDDFNESRFGFFWIVNRVWNDNLINLNGHSGILRLYGGRPLQEEENVAMLLRRQTAFCYEACCHICCHFAIDGDCAGIVCYQNERFNLRLQLKLMGKVVALQIIKTVDGQDEVMLEDIVDGGCHELDMVLRIVAEKQVLKFEYGHDERNMNLFKDNVDSTFLSPDKCNGCSGIMVGMFAVAGGDFNQKQFYADYDWFKYENITREFIS